MQRIRPVLRCYPPDCQPTRVESLGAAGGMSGAQFWRIVAPRGTLVLRRWPSEHPTPDGLRFIHDVLRHAADRGSTVLPVPISTLNGATFVSHASQLWELAAWLPGTADYERSPRIEKLRAAMTALAEFHNAVRDFPFSSSPGFSEGPNAINSRLARLREIQSGGSDTLARTITDSHWPELAPLARQFVAALMRVVPPAINQLAPLADVQFPLQPCIRDIWQEHVLFDGERVTGLIDFGAMQIDTPASDVARLLGSMAPATSVVAGVCDPDKSQDPTTAVVAGVCDPGESQDPASQRPATVAAETWRIGLAAYSTVRPLSEPETEAVAALDTSGTILAGCNWIRWIYVDGRQFENPPQIVARFARILARLPDL